MLEERDHRRRWGEVPFGIIARAGVVAESLDQRKAMGRRRTGGYGDSA